MRTNVAGKTHDRPASTPSAPGASEIDGRIRELTGEAEPANRSREDWETALRAVVGKLITATSWPGVQGSPWLLLDEIAHRTLEAGSGARRSALAKALRERWTEAASLNERIFILRQLALVGEEDSVPLLSELLESNDGPLGEYTLRALEENPSPRAGEAILAALERSADPRSRVALVNALGARCEEALAGRLEEMHSLEKDESARDALRAALCRVRTR